MTAPHDLATVENVPHGRTARRLEWGHLPPSVRRLVEQRLGAPVVSAESQGGGFTPGFASRLTAENGARLFVKAASKKAQPQFAASYAEEARKVALLPPGTPATRLVWTHDDELWILLAFESVEGRQPHRPWRERELAACLDTLAAVAEALSPVPEAMGLRPVTDDLPTLLTGWDAVRTSDPEWPHLDDAAALAASYPGFPGNDAFVHTDARDDNFLITPADPAATGGPRALLCDWNWPALGPRWMDAVYLLVSAYGDGLDADALVASHRLTRDADPAHVDASLAMLAGFMLEARERPVPATSPYIRVHSNWWAEAAWAWLASRRGWR
jgi:aminoglycoside phosphotransferase (APT) family kinase protein